MKENSSLQPYINNDIQWGSLNHASGYDAILSLLSATGGIPSSVFYN